MADSKDETPLVELGYAEEIENEWRLKGKYFPSKIGGRPIWLGLDDSIPGLDQLSCEKCEQFPMTFIMQIYCPSPIKSNVVQLKNEGGQVEEDYDGFHRTLYIFGCSKCGSQYKVFRSQLRRKNPFYSFDPPNYDCDEETDPEYDPKPQQFGVKLCDVCGIRSTKNCAKCQKASYCSRHHQVWDWKHGGHSLACKLGEEACNTSSNSNAKGKSCSFLLPEFDIIMDAEENEDEEGASSSRSEEDKMKELKEFIDKTQPSFQNQSLDDLERNQIQEDKNFLKFKKIIKNNPEQVLRYYGFNKDAIPLWVSDKDKTPELIPKCPNCDAPRVVECQIMPQLLTILGVIEGLDWGTLIIYSCSQSCNSNRFYQEEFIWNQPI